MIRQTDPLGNATEYAYDDRGNLVEVIKPHALGTQAADFTTRYTYNNRDELTAIVMPSGGVLIMEYDLRGNMLSIRDEEGNPLFASEYGEGGVVTRTTDLDGTRTSVYDTRGNEVEGRDEFGLRKSMVYDPLGRLTSMTDGRGNTFTIAYDRLGREIGADYGQGVSVTTEYDLGSDWTALEGPTIGRIERELTPGGQPAGWVLPGGDRIVYRYDRAGRLTEMIDEAGRKTRYEYDAAGRRTKVVGPRNDETTYEYDAAGRLVQETNTLGHATAYTYYPDSRMESRTDENLNKYTYTYTATSTTITDPLGRRQTEVRSPQGLPVGVINPDGSKIHIDYRGTSPLQDAEDEPTAVTDEGGHVRHYEYSDVGLLVSATDRAGAPYTYTYDVGNLLSVEDPVGERISFAYDDRDLLRAVTYPDRTVQHITYSPGSLPDTVTRPSGVSISHEYDAARRETDRVSSLGDTIHFAYNPGGMVKTIEDSTGTTRYDYDAGGGLAGLDFPSGATLHYERDLLGRLVKVTARASPTTGAHIAEYGYDPAGNLVLVVDPLGGRTAIEYDRANRMVRRTLPNGVTTTYEYDDRDEITAVVHRDSAGGILASTSYERQGVGEPVRIIREDNSVVALRYDSALRLSGEDYIDPSGVPVEQIDYTYDVAGKRVGKSNLAGEFTSHYEPGRRLVQVDGPAGNDESYQYDPDGRLVGISRDGRSMSLEYDSFDRLLGVTDPVSGGRVQYAHDGLGRRVGSQGPAGERRYVVGPTVASPLESPYLVTSEDGSVIAGYVYVGEQPLMRFGPDGPVYYLADPLGSVIALADGAGGLAARFAYDGFGNLRESTGLAVAPPAGVEGDFRFHGAWLEHTTGLYHFRARDYDPRVGRFITPEPAEPDPHTPESFDPYTFANANPYLFHDPTGLFSMAELNSVQGIVSNLQRIAGIQLRSYFKDRVKDAAAEIVIGAIEKLVPGLGALDKIVDLIPGKNNGTQGVDFGDFLQHQFCEPFRGSRLIDYVFLEVSVGADGKPLHDGFSCGQPIELKGLLKTLGLKKQPPRPDFLISEAPPTELEKGSGPKSFLIGDFKVRPENIRADKQQFKAIYNHAANYEYSRVALYITLFGGRTRESISQAVKQAGGAVIFIVSILDPKK